MLVNVSELLSLPGPRAHLMHCALGGVLQWSLNTGAGLTWAQVRSVVKERWPSQGWERQG